MCKFLYMCWYFLFIPLTVSHFFLCNIPLHCVIVSDSASFSCDLSVSRRQKIEVEIYEHLLFKIAFPWTINLKLSTLKMCVFGSYITSSLGVGVGGVEGRGGDIYNVTEFVCPLQNIQDERVHWLESSWIPTFWVLCCETCYHVMFRGSYTMRWTLDPTVGSLLPKILR